MNIKKLISIWQILLRFILRLPSRIFFGNYNRLSNNLSPYFYSFYWKIIFKNTPLTKNGFIKIDFNLDDKLILNIKKQFDKFMNNPSKTYFEKGHSKKIFIKNPLEIDGLKRLLEIFKDTLNEYYDGKYKIYKISCWRTLYDESRENQKEDYIFSNYWHFDDFKGSNLKAFVLLNNNTNKNTGSTKLLNIRDSKLVTRTLKYIDTSLSNFKLNEFVTKNNMVFYCNGNLGDAYLVDTNKCLHSASIPEKGKYRDLIQFEISHSLVKSDPFKDFDFKNASV